MEERSMRKKPVVLMILDGYGLNDKVEGQYPCNGLPDEGVSFCTW